MSELDKTIEELEAEVQAELEEAKQPTDGADKGDSKMEKVEGEVQDLGKAVVSPDEKKGADAAKATKPIKDAQNKGAKDAKGDDEPTKIKEPLAAGHEVDHDGEELEEGRMTKSEMINAMYEKIKKMEGMKATDIQAAYGAMMKDESMDGEEEEMDESTLEERLAGVDVSEDVTALTEGEDLSEEFKGKAATIFEAAVKSKLRSEVERIESAKTQEVAEEINRVRDELTEKVDAYMNYVVEEWMKENELAIERGLKGEIAEDFITGLKGLFEEHYIDVPDEKYDILEAQSEKIDELESKINEQIEKSASLKKENDQLVRESVFAKVSSDLADTEVEKFKSLAEDVDFNGEESFTEKLNTLKESYFPKATAIAESVDSETNGDDSNDTTGAMAAYMAAISKNVNRAK
jgi:membrane-associated HD superfamily phosphohydrolase